MALADLQAAEQEAASRSQDEHSVAVCLRDSGKLIGDLFAKPEDDTFMVGWNFNPAFGKQGLDRDRRNDVLQRMLQCARTGPSSLPPSAVCFKHRLPIRATSHAVAG